MTVRKDASFKVLVGTNVGRYTHHRHSGTLGMHSVYACVHVCMCAGIYVFVYIYADVCMYVCIYALPMHTVIYWHRTA